MSRTTCDSRCKSWRHSVATMLRSLVRQTLRSAATARLCRAFRRCFPLTRLFDCSVPDGGFCHPSGRSQCAWSADWALGTCVLLTIIGIGSSASERPCEIGVSPDGSMRPLLVISFNDTVQPSLHPRRTHAESIVDPGGQGTLDYLLTCQLRVISRPDALGRLRVFAKNN